jgi:signal transduction histidine kinase
VAGDAHRRAITGSQLIIRRENGVETPLLAHAAPLREESGAITSAVVAFQDITAFKELERLKDEFISVASHELKQPLTAINGQAQLLKRHLRRLATADMTTWAHGGDLWAESAGEGQGSVFHLVLPEM